MRYAVDFKHQGGLGAIPGKWERPLAGGVPPLPTYPNDVGGAANEPPVGVAIPKVRNVEASSQFWLPDWAREVVDRNDTPEELVRIATARVLDQPTEGRFLEALAIINELGRSVQHSGFSGFLRTVLSNGIWAGATLYSGPAETGNGLQSPLIPGDRYSAITNSILSSEHLLDSVASGSLVSNAPFDLNLILFQNGDYTGLFQQISLSSANPSETYWHTGPVQSALLIASNNIGSKEKRISLVDAFRSKWDSFLDDKLKGTAVSRDVEPLLTWQMFPTGNQWLNSSQTYLRIHQPLHVHLPWYWHDYQASMDYNIVLYITGDQHLRAWVADWECWVEGGAKNGKVHDQLNPQVEASMSALQDQMNQALALTDLLGPIKAVFYLPSKQLSPIGSTRLGGNTSDDITIAIQT
jgi:hypothetical protein